MQIRRNAEAQLQLLINATGEGIFGLDDEGRISFMNPAGLHCLGYGSPSQVVGQDAHILLNHAGPDNVLIEDHACQIQAAWRQGLSGHSEDELFRRKDGTTLAVEYHVHPLRSAHELVGAVVNFSDISVRKALQQSIWHQANFDSLTGIANRSMMQDRLKNAVEQARRAQGKVALLYIDLNDFKPVNDRLGHEAGDEVLRVVARRIESLVRQSDTVARVGGDEFVVILNQVDARASVDRVAEKVAHEIAQPMEISGTPVTIGAAIGIALFPEDADTPASLLGKADQAMYQSKAGGDSA